MEKKGESDELKFFFVKRYKAREFSDVVSF